MRKILSALVMLLVLLSCKPEKDTFIIQGRLVGLEDEFIYLIHPGEGEQKLDTLQVKNGKFRIKGKITQPDIYYLSMPSQEEAAVEIFAESGKFIISGNAADPDSWKVEGGELQKIYDGYRNVAKPVLKEYRKITAEHSSKAAGSVDAARLEEQMDELTERYFSEVLKYIEKQPVTMVTAYVVAKEFLYDPDFARIDPLVAAMSEDVKASTYGKMIVQNLESARKTAPGVLAPLFSLPDMEGNSISLESYKGKYVLVDFWASWCGPCRKENPRMLSIYNKYKGPQFEMLGVSIDRMSEQWKLAVQEDQLSWTQVIDKSDVSGTLYGIVGVPANVLVAPDGKIVARNLFGKKLDQKLASLLKKPAV